MSKAEALVKLKFPTAKCLRGGGTFQIWVVLLSFAGNKLATGRTENEAWKNAAKACNG